MSSEVEVTSSSKYPIFDGKDKKFRFYKVKMMAHLSKYGFNELTKAGAKVEPDTYTPPSTGQTAAQLAEIRDMQKKNSRAAGILLDSINVETKEGEVAFDLLAAFQTKEYAAGQFKEMWEAMLDLYDAEDAGEVAARRKEYYALKMDIKENPKKFEIGLSVKRSKLSKDGFKISDDEYIKDLLEKMPKKDGELGVYYEVKKSVLRKLKQAQHGVTVKDVVSDLCEIYDEIKDREDITKEEKSDAAFMIGGKQFKGRCRNCGAIGHKMSHCPEKKSNGSDKGQRKGGSRFSKAKNDRGERKQYDKKKFSGKCFHCGIRGHRKDECRKLKAENNGSERAHAAQETEELAFTTIDGLEHCMTCNNTNTVNCRECQLFCFLCSMGPFRPIIFCL